MGKSRLGSLGGTTISLIGSWLPLDTINQLKLTLLHPYDPINHCAKSLYSVPRTFIERGEVYLSEYFEVLGGPCI